jgi:hypothetical protein
MKLPTVTKGLAAIAFLGASTALNAALVLTPGAFGAFTAPVAGPVGPIALPLVSSVADDNGNFSAKVTSNVYGAPGAYTFSYVIENVADGAPVNSDLFAFALRFSASYVPASVTLNQAIGIDNSPYTGLYSGTSLFITFGGGAGSLQIAEGQKSVAILVSVASPSYGVGVGSVIDGTSEDAGVYIPLIPEPTTYAGMFALGLAGFAAYRRFRS